MKYNSKIVKQLAQRAFLRNI